MPVTLWLPALVKALATALLVVVSSAVAEAAGSFWGALIASLPVSAGPAYVFLSMKHDQDYVAASALSSLAANAATGLFLIVYGLTARRLPAWRALGFAVLTWLAGSLATQQVVWTPLTASAINLVIYCGGFVAIKTVDATLSGPGRSMQRRPFDLPARALAVAAFVSLIVAVSSVSGPTTTGIAAVFPVSLISLFVILRPRIGGPACSLLAANALRSMLGFGGALLALHLAIEPCGISSALFMAGLVSVAWSGILMLIRQNRHVS